MPKKPAKPSQKPPERGEFYTPEAVRARVIARHVNGESNRRIALEEDIHRETVGKILRHAQAEVLRLKAETQSKLFSLLPKAADVYAEAMSSKDLRTAMGPATKLLGAAGMFKKGGLGETKPDPVQQWNVALGQLFNLMLNDYADKADDEALRAVVQAVKEFAPEVDFEDVKKASPNAAVLLDRVFPVGFSEAAMDPDVGWRLSLGRVFDRFLEDGEHRAQLPQQLVEALKEDLFETRSDRELEEIRKKVPKAINVLGLEPPHKEES